jgi:cell division protease FtsH
MFWQANKGPHYTTKFGDLKSFKKKTRSSWAEKKLVNYDFKEASNWSDILISLLPIIIIAFGFYHEKMSGGGAGGGGQILILASQKQNCLMKNWY